MKIDHYKLFTVKEPPRVRVLTLVWPSEVLGRWIGWEFSIVDVLTVRRMWMAEELRVMIADAISFPLTGHGASREFRKLLRDFGCVMVLKKG
jgi:hypothetical protein